ncbi:MAG: type II toxin-antitoxin system HicB family antitoxin [Parachlamydiales bacterium]|nr:type II toxin-antitoxin system HicB family antitoxin [Parachlamydiales bacterium]
MELQGRVWKDGNVWLIEVPSINIVTQGRTKKNAFAMLQDAVKEIILSYFDLDLTIDKIVVTDRKLGCIGLKIDSLNILLSLLLIRQREISGVTIRSASKALGSNSPNQYAQYEKGRINISFEMYEKLLHAINPKSTYTVNVING